MKRGRWAHTSHSCRMIVRDFRPALQSSSRAVASLEPTTDCADCSAGVAELKQGKPKRAKGKLKRGKGKLKRGKGKLKRGKIKLKRGKIKIAIVNQAGDLAVAKRRRNREERPGAWGALGRVGHAFVWWLLVSGSIGVWLPHVIDIIMKLLS
jgi:hypothetical protein